MFYYETTTKEAIRLSPATGEPGPVIVAEVPSGIPYRILHVFPHSGMAVISTETEVEGLTPVDPENPIVTSHEVWFASYPSEAPEVLTNP